MMGSLKEHEASAKFIVLNLPNEGGIGVRESIGTELETTNSTRLIGGVGGFNKSNLIEL